MKNAKKLIACLLVALMTLSTFAGFVFADAESGTITVTNALAETTYDLYRAFDATYTVTKDAENKDVKYVAYTLDASTAKGAALLAAIKAAADDDGYDDNDQVINGGVCSFEAKQIGTSDIYEISQKSGFPEAAGRGWLKTQIDNLTLVDSKECAVDSETVVFDEDVTPGYYLVFATNEGEDDPGSIVTVTTAAPNATIIDKNVRVPSDLEKTTPNFSAEIGEDVPFTVSFEAVNFRTNALGDTGRIIRYALTDTAVTGLDYKSSTNNTVFGDSNGTIKLYKTKNDDGTFSDPLYFVGDDEAPAGETLYTPVEWTYDATNHKIVIIWGDEVIENSKVVSSTSRYPSNVYVVIEYDMTVNEDTYAPVEGGFTVAEAENRVHGDVKISDVASVESFGDDNEKVKNAGISIRKVDSKKQSTALSGAEFVLYKNVTETVPDPDNEGQTKNVTVKKYWTYDTDANSVVWVDDEEDADFVVADNQTGTAEFYGLKEGTYYIKETKAPAGYALPDADYTLVIFKDGDDLDATVNGTAVTVNANGIFTTIITNSNNDNLPETGGIGTTIFYIVGGVLFVGAAITIITKKRMSAR